MNIRISLIGKEIKVDETCCYVSFRYVNKNGDVAYMLYELATMSYEEFESYFHLCTHLYHNGISPLIVYFDKSFYNLKYNTNA